MCDLAHSLKPQSQSTVRIFDNSAVLQSKVSIKQVLMRVTKVSINFNN